MDNKTPIQRVCPSCGTVFTTAIAKRKFCSNTCRSTFGRQKTKQETRELAQRVHQQNSELSTLKERGAPPAISTPPHTPTWQRANRLCKAKQALCDRLKKALDEKRQELRTKTGPGRYYYLGGVLGVGLVLIVLSFIYEDIRRERRLVGASFWISSAVSTILVGLLSARLGHRGEQEVRSLAATARYKTEIRQMEEEVETLVIELKQQESELEALLRVLDAIEPFEASLPPPMKNSYRLLTRPD